MTIADMRVKLTIQKQTVSVDSIGNHQNVWTDYYSCRAMIGGENDASRSTKKGSEEEKAAHVIDHIMLDFTIRYCNTLANITSTNYRVKYNNEFYDIVTVNHMNMQKQTIRLRCKKVERS